MTDKKRPITELSDDMLTDVSGGAILFDNPTCIVSLNIYITPDTSAEALYTKVRSTLARNQIELRCTSAVFAPYVGGSQPSTIRVLINGMGEITDIQQLI